MSRSYKKTPKGGWTTCPSEKQDKKIWHKRMRAHERDISNVAKNLEPDEAEDVEFPKVREVSDKWDMGKDGKTYHGEYKEGDGWLDWWGNWKTYYDDKLDYFKRILRK